MKVFKMVLITTLLVVVLGITALGAKAQSETATVFIYIKEASLNDHSCNSNEWGIVINQISEESLAPASVHVTWQNGNKEDVPLWKFTGDVAHYVTSSNLSSRIVGAYTQIYAEWKDGGGQFNLSHGPCLISNTPTPTSTEEPNTPTATTTASPTQTTTSDPDKTPTPTNTPGPNFTPTPTEPKLGGELPDRTPVIPIVLGFIAIAGVFFRVGKTLLKKI